LNTKYYIILFLLIFATNGLCDSVQIESIDPMPDFKNVGGPAFGEKVKSYSGKGLVQYVSSTKMMINSKMYFVDQTSPCVEMIETHQIKRASIVSFTLNKKASVNQLKLIVQLDFTGILDRMDDIAVVCDDTYRELYIHASFHDISDRAITRYDFDIGDFIGMTVNQDRQIESLWYLNGYFLY